MWNIFSYVLSKYSIGPTPTPALVSQQCKKNSTVQRLVPVTTLVATVSKWFRRLYVTCSCCSWPCLELPYIKPSGNTKNDHWPMVPTVMKNGPRHSFTKNASVPQIVTNDPNTCANIAVSTPIHRFIDQSVSHGRYRRSVPFHLRRITVNCRSTMNDRHNFMISLFP